MSRIGRALRSLTSPPLTRRCLLGSVTEKVLRKALCPVLTVPAGV